MTALKQYYPAGANADTVAITCDLASLADDNTNGVAGRSSLAVDNRTNLDLDHIVTGKIKLGTSPTANRYIEIWAYIPIAIASGTPTYPDTLLGTDAAKTLTSLNVKFSALAPGPALITDASTGLVIPIRGFSIASLFGDMPPLWALFIINRSGAALDSTSGNHSLVYHREQRQI